MVDFNSIGQQLGWIKEGSGFLLSYFRNFDRKSFGNQIEIFFEHRGQLYGKSLRNFSIIASAKYYSIIFSDIDFYKKFEVILSLILLFLIISAISYFLLSKSKKYHFDITNLNFRLFVVGANIIVIKLKYKIRCFNNLNPLIFITC